ncbi:MAG: hypothetical protein K6E32_01250 [Lachnospiraceae bacterium]|nr:hypothetical protein [Lachnospiraceae bacterium]
MLEKPYWILDILPKQVPKDSPGQYFAIEDFFLKEQLTEIKKKHMTVFNPDEELLGLIREISSSEGLFVWKG